MDSAPVKTGERIVSLDVLKGLIIIAIVFVHLIFLVPSDDVRSNNPLFLQGMYTWLMVFFIIAGYFYRSRRTPAQNIVRRVKQILPMIIITIMVLPIFLWGYATLLGVTTGGLDSYLYNIQAVIGSIPMFGQFNGDFTHDLLRTDTGMYFLQLMIPAFAIFYLVVDHVLDDEKKFIAAIIILVTVTAIYDEFVRIQIPFFADLSPIAAAFMLLGARLGKMKFVEQVEAKDAWKTKRYWLVFLISLVAGVALLVVFPTGVAFDCHEFGDHGGWSAYPYFVIATFLAVVFIYIGSWIGRVRFLSDALRIAGKHTLAILCGHVFVLKVLIISLGYEIPSVSLFPKVPLSVALVIGFATIIILILVGEYGPKLIRKLSEHNVKDKSE